MSIAMRNPFVEAKRALLLLESGQHSLDLTLNRIVVGIANHMQTDVGSMYLLEPRNDSLLLVATVGLVQSFVGKLRMRMDEGLVGMVAQQQVPVVLAHASQHSRFKHFPEADEDKYQSFLGVPITHRRDLHGVLVVQTLEPRFFTSADTEELTRVATLLGPLFQSNAA